MVRFGKVKRGLLAAAAIGPIVWAGDVAAEVPSATESTASVDEVVVTARKREETIHDAPLSVSVVDGDALRESPISSAQGLNGAVPGLAMQIGYGNVTSPSFRGLGSNSALYSVESSVALFIDGVYMGHPRAYATPLYDIERFEMIKGTQASLLGKNTSVGAISQITRKPGSSFDYSLTSTYEFEYHSPRIEGYVNAPVSDTLSLRFAALYDLDAGYMENAFTGDGEGRTENVSGRLSARWAPSDSLDIEASYQHDHRIQWGQYQEVLREATAGATFANRAALTGQTNFEARPDLRNASASLAVGSVPAGSPPKDTQTGDRANLLVNWNIGAYMLTSQSAYVGYDVLRSGDLDFLSAHLFDLLDNERDSQFTQEVRLASPSGERFSFMVGAYYLREDWSLDRTYTGYSPAPGVFPLTGSAVTYFTQKTQSTSLFGHADFGLTQDISLSAGLRYTSEQKDGHYFRPPGTGVLGLTYPAIPRTVLTVSDDTLDGDVGVQYRPSDDLMVYASYSKGSKSGGLQNFPTTLAGATYTGETAYTTELGAKKLFGNYGSLDVALFQTDLDDYQFTRIAAVNGVNQTIVANVDIRSKGAEVHTAWRIPGLPRVSLGVVYADVLAKETVPGPPAQAAIAAGLRLPRAPKYTGNLTVDHSLPINAELDFRVKAEAQYSSPMFLQPNINASLGAPMREEYTQVHLRAGVVNDEKGWELALVGRNLTDVRTPIFASPASATGITGTNTVAFIGTLMPPRTIALQLTIRR